MQYRIQKILSVSQLFLSSLSLSNIQNNSVEINNPTQRICDRRNRRNRRNHSRQKALNFPLSLLSSSSLVRLAANSFAFFVNPANFAVSPDNPVFKDVRSSGCYTFFDSSLHIFAVLRMDNAGKRTDAIVDKIRRGIA